MGTVSIGVDVGKQPDPTAIAAVEMEPRVLEEGRWALPKAEGHFTGADVGWVPARTEEVYFSRFLERLPLGTPYPEVATRIVAVVTNVREYYKGRLELLVDATSVGVPVVDMIRAELKRSANVRVLAVTFTAGAAFTRHDDKSASLGKGYLVSRLCVLVETHRIKLPETAEAAAMAQELQVYNRNQTQDGADQYGAKTGKHDDLVTALGLAVLPPRIIPTLVTW